MNLKGNRKKEWSWTWSRLNLTDLALYKFMFYGVRLILGLIGSKNFRPKVITHGFEGL